MQYYQGQRIRCRNEEWQITKAVAHLVVNGGKVWEITARGLTGIVRGIDFCFMSDLDNIEIIDPSEIEPVADKSGRGRRSKLYWEAHLRRLLPRNGAIFIGQHGACTPYPFQLEPAGKALGLVRPRILIGDAVGLGKTIECGILLSELMRRGKGRRVLAAVPKAILEQFQTEMWGRFSIPFERLDSKGLERLKQDLPSTMNPFYHFDKAIISIDTLKLKNYQKLLEDCHWDVLIIDECHNVADRTDGGGGSGRHRVAKRLAETSNSVILMSATPHDGTKHGFASLIKLLDRTKIPNEDEYNKNCFSDHFIRRNRTNVSTQIHQKGVRKQIEHDIQLKDSEIEVLRFIHNSKDITEDKTKRSSRGSKELFRTTLIKSFLSSPSALNETVQNKLKVLSKRKNQESNEFTKFKEFLNELINKIEALTTFSRLEFLGEYIKKNPTSNSNRLVIFTERLATMNLIKEYLLKEQLVEGFFNPEEDKPQGDKLLATAYGSISDIKINRIVKSFQAKKNGIEILVATNVASEGLNLHHNCYRLIHFDLPWSLITLEQRNGRIDRLGQKEIPIINYFASQAPKLGKNDKIKDDFWIIDKIKKRIEIASLDMDEEAASRFADSDSEEATYTQKYEENSLQDDPCDLINLLSEQESVDQSNTSKSKTIAYRKSLPTLFEKSPGEFVEGICKEAGIQVVENDGQSLTIEIDHNLKFEINKWPKEFRPHYDSKHLTLQMDHNKMERYYEKQLNDDSYFDMSFMNEIHPVLNLLETTAMGLFDGKCIPTVTYKGDEPNTVCFLVQASLFNACNEVVMQYWQVLKQKKGSPKFESIVDITSNDHAIKITEWLNKTIKSMTRRNELEENEIKRLKSLSSKVINIMKEQSEHARKVRSEVLGPQLREEVKRIKSWEKSRETYLKRFVESKDLATHLGMFSQVNKAKKELETLKRDSQNYNDFIQAYLTTNKDPDIQILGCFIAGE